MGSRSLPLLRLCGASTAVVGGALYSGAQTAADEAVKVRPPVEQRI